MGVAEPNTAIGGVPATPRLRDSFCNPETGAASRSFVLAGKVDGIVKHDGQYFLLEHKTASQIDAGYLERLWTDFQIILYAWYIERTLGITIAGIIYNVLVKARLRQGQGETEAEYEARRAEMIAKSKTGKTSANEIKCLMMSCGN